MKIEIDTEKATKEELRHLAAMLSTLSGSSGAVMAPTASVQDSEPASEGLFSLFDDDPKPAETIQESPPVHSVVEPAPEQSEPASGGLFSLFGDEPKPDMQSETPALQEYPEMPSSVSIDDTEEEEDKKPTTAQEMLDDDSIVPY